MGAGGKIHLQLYILHEQNTKMNGKGGGGLRQLLLIGREKVEDEEMEEEDGEKVRGKS